MSASLPAGVPPQPAPRAPRVGSVPYLNAAPLTFGLEDDLLFAPPARLAALLREEALDAALVSLAEVLLEDRYEILDGAAISSRGPVESVLLAGRRPLEEAREVFCDPASITGINLARVLLAERGIRPVFRPMASPAEAAGHEFVMLIGDPALDFVLEQREHQIWDLGQEWRELTGLPFVYAVWALRRAAPNPGLRARLRDARQRGLAALPQIVRERPEYTEAFRARYLGGSIRYDLGPEEKLGAAKFAQLLRKHGAGPVHEPRYVE